MFRVLFAIASLTCVLIATPVFAQSSTTPAADQGLSRKGRISLELLGGTGGALTAAGLGIGAGLLVQQRCVRGTSDDDDAALDLTLGCPLRGALTMVGVGGFLLPVTTTLGTQLVHRGSGGKGRWWATGLGAVGGVVAGGSVVALSGVLSHEQGPGFAAGWAVGSALLIGMPTLAAEWSHTRQARASEERARTAKRSFALSPVASVLQGGALLGIAGSM